MSCQSKQQIEILKKFSKQANKLMDEKFNPLHSAKIRMSFFADSKNFGNVKSKLPNNDLLKIFLIDFRFFYIRKNNPYNFEKICQFFIDNDFEKEKVQEWLDVYKKILSDNSVKIKVNKKQLTTKKIFNSILNEEHFHQEGNQKGINDIKLSPFIESMARMKFFDVIGKLRRIICSFNKQIVEKFIEIELKKEFATELGEAK